ncbi:MAG: HAMP domain-containing histidine kinase [Firmicutes bacterium]|nr:HAMP domain-containing histidine kinase [Bacillota bacterium]
MEENTIVKKKSGLFFSGLLKLLCAASGTACGFCIAAAVMSFRLYTATIFDKYIYSFAAEFIDEAGRQSFKGMAILAAAGFGLITLLLLALLSAMTGKYKRTAEGGVYLNWFDKVWTEIHICCIAVFSALAAAVCVPIIEVLSSESYFRFYTPYIVRPARIQGIPNDNMLVLCGIGLFLCIWLVISFFLSIVRKLKAKSFWRTSLIGTVVLAIGGFFSRCSKSLLNAFAPKTMARFEDIKKGVEEVRSGNLTYKIPVEDRARGMNAELNELAAGINDISHAADIAVQNELKNQRMKTSLISNVSHDIKTPLTSMISYVDLLKTEGLDSPSAPEYLEILDQKTQRLKQLTDNLFDAAKAASGSLPCKIEAINMAELVNQALGETDEKLKEKGLEVILKNSCERPLVKADGQLLWRVIDNLLNNVCKYALEGSRVYVDIAQVKLDGGAGNYVGLQIKNISRDQLNISAEELMERSTRGDQSRNTEGSGLGLSIANDLTQMMNGSFSIAVDGDLFKALLVLEQA